MSVSVPAIHATMLYVKPLFHVHVSSEPLDLLQLMDGCNVVSFPQEKNTYNTCVREREYTSDNQYETTFLYMYSIFVTLFYRFIGLLKFFQIYNFVSHCYPAMC